MSLSGKTPNFANSFQNMNQNIYKNICAKYQVDTCSEEACRGVFQKTALLKNPIYDSNPCVIHCSQENHENRPGAIPNTWGNSESAIIRQQKIIRKRSCHSHTAAQSEMKHETYTVRRSLKIQTPRRVWSTERAAWKLCQVSRRK